MSFLRDLTRLRLTVRALTRIAHALEEQNRHLARIANAVNPDVPEISDEDLKTSGPSFSRDAEQGKILDFCARVYADTGRSPTDDEIVDYLEGRA